MNYSLERAETSSLRTPTCDRTTPNIELDMVEIGVLEWIQRSAENTYSELPRTLRVILQATERRIARAKQGDAT